MNEAALYDQEIREKVTQRGTIDHMQTREELYQILNYNEYEWKADHLVI